VRVLSHIKRLDDCFGDFLVRVTCPCGASRHIEPEALARIGGKATTLVEPRCPYALLLAVRKEDRGGGRGGEAELR
jgi:hypothetical protein